MNKLTKYRKFIGDKSLINDAINNISMFKNPLTQMPESDMRVYTVDNKYFFDIIDETLNYCRICNCETNNLTVLDYYSELANMSNVIKIQNSNKIELCAMVDNETYALYNNEESIYNGEYVWDYNQGNIEDMYKPFVDRGISINNKTKKKVS